MISFSSFFEQYLCSVLHDRQETAFELSNFSIFAESPKFRSNYLGKKSKIQASFKCRL